jgi:hypothetical protein
MLVFYSLGGKVCKMMREAWVTFDKDVGGRPAGNKVGQAENWPGGWGDSVLSDYGLRAGFLGAEQSSSFGSEKVGSTC